MTPLADPVPAGRIREKQSRALGAGRNLVYPGAAVECSILVPLKGLNEKARTRFIDSHTGTNPERFRELRNKETV